MFFNLVDVLQEGRIGGLTTNDSAPWMVGRLSRKDCERLMLRKGREKDFLIRSRSPPVRITLTSLVRNSIC